MIGVNDIRSAFINFYVKNGHEKVASSSLVPSNDPSLMFTNAGMVQFKNIFTGQEHSSYSKATTSQKCVRAGGKHNDLDNVGYTARHHTFFEMMGNFSFGDYFKDTAIELAWDLVTKEFCLNPRKLYVTVYHEDEQSFNIWKKLTGFTEEKIIRIDSTDNFWTMGDTGPCGPCSEIFYDHGDKFLGGPPGSTEQDGDRFVEIWNLVFMQFEHITPELRIDLPKPSIDTGMGLERVAALLQGTHDNYETDLFRTLIAASEEATKVKAVGEALFSHRVIADHLRASSFLIADGVLPSNEGRGYVLRRIMRRAMRHAHILGAKDPLLHRLVDVMVNLMGTTYPELKHDKEFISQTLYLEESRFHKTLDRGITLLKNKTEALSKGDVLSGDIAFRLYDTYGFPLDLTQDALRARDIGVDVNAFHKAMEIQKTEARSAWKGSGEAAIEKVWFELREQIGVTEFVGYETEKFRDEIRAIVENGREVSSARVGDKVQIITCQTPFYAESGGQSGDKGLITCGEASTFQVLDTQKKAGALYVHIGKVIDGTFKVGDTVDLEVDHWIRSATCSNHSATHLLHKALRIVLGNHVVQKGSYVGPDRLRFDFTHPRPMNYEELFEVEKLVNSYVFQNSVVQTHIMAYKDALKLGATALFGEKYGVEVRVVSMGNYEDISVSNGAWSVELCGGTHVVRTGDIGLIHVLGEMASSSGVRRIEALSAQRARMHLTSQDKRMSELSSLLRVKSENVVERVTALVEESKQLGRKLAEAKRELALGSVVVGNFSSPENNIRHIDGVKFLSRLVKGLRPKDLRSLVDSGKDQVGSGIVAIIGVTDDGKAGLSVGVTADLTERFNAVDLAKVGALALGSKGGGGRPDMAQAGGPDGAKAVDALKAIELFLTE
ncbi:MAG: Alanine--tRNA ligase [Hyphomicrobiaceae bacterium hypho_1]